MMNKVNQWYVSDLLETLKFHGGMQLSPDEYRNLTQCGSLFLSSERIKPYFDELKDYLQNNQTINKGWCLTRIEDVSHPLIFGYMLMIQNDQQS